MTTAVSPSVVGRFAELFAGRDDARGTYVVNKQGEAEYEAVRERITLDHYRRHLEGETLGVYCLSNEGTTHWLCLDFDRPDIDEALRCKQLLATYGFVSYIETSKQKGYHLWVFFSSPADAAHVRQVAKAVLRNAGCDPATEIFPRQDRLPASTGGGQSLGNFVNLPFPGNLAPGKRVMLNDNLEEMTVDEFIVVAQQNDPLLLKRIIPTPAPADDGRRRIIAPSSRLPGYTGPDPACIRAATQLPAGSGHRHNVGMRLAQYWTHMRQFDEDTVWQLLCDWNASNSPPLSEGDLADCMAGVTSDPTCSWLRKEKLFADACTWRACIFNKPGDGVPPPAAVIPLTVIDAATTASPTRLQEQAEERRMVERLCGVGFIGAFVDWMKQTTDAPALYHCLAALATIAASVGNEVRAESFGNDMVRPNVWLSIIAPSGIYRKSTAISAAERLLAHYAEMLDRLLPNDFTGKAFIDHLAENPAGLLVIDELSGFLQGLNQKFQSGTKMLLTKLYEAPAHTVTRVGSGTVTVRNPAITILAASTRHNLQKELDQDDFSTGFLARMLFVPGSVKEAWKGLGATKPDPSKPDELAAAVRQFRQYSGVISFDRVLETFNTWNRAYEERATPDKTLDMYTGLVSRAGKLVQKFAMLFQIGASMGDRGQRGNWATIEPWALELAIDWTEWVIGRQIELITDEFAFTADSRDRQRLVEYVKKHGGYATRSDVSRNTGYAGKKLDAIAEAAEEAGFLQIVSTQKPGIAGRPGIAYQLLASGPQPLDRPETPIQESA